MRSFAIACWAITALALALVANVALAAPLSAPAPGPTFIYTLTQPGYVSAAVYDTSGRMVRPLIYGEKQEAGGHSLFWDGLDRYGNTEPPGSYEWRVLRTPGFTREFLLDLGTNITWRQHDYWPGNHSGPSSLMVDDDGSLYVGSLASEGPPPIIKLTHDGKKLLWDSVWGFPGGVFNDMVRVGGTLYVLMSDGTLKIANANSGGPYWGDPVLGKFFSQPAPGAATGQFANLIHSGEKNPTSPPMRLAGGKDFLVVCYKDFDEVRLLWPKGAVFERDETVAVPQPTSATVGPDGTIYVLSGNGIVAIDPSTHKTDLAITDPDLPNIGTVAFDPAFGDLLVAGGSNVRRYHAADGKLVAVYGRLGGRTYGAFNPMDFDTLFSIAADGTGGFFTAEQFPRRVAHFSGRETLQLVQQWFGGMAWEWQAIVDPADPTITYLPIDYKHMGRGVVDYANHTWTLTDLYETPEGFSYGSGSGGGDPHYYIFPRFGGAYEGTWQVRHVAGQTFLLHTAGGVMVVRVDENQHKLEPVACLGGLKNNRDNKYPPAWWVAGLKRMGIDASSQVGLGTDFPKAFIDAGRFSHFAYSWSDVNHVGRFQDDGVQVGSIGPVNIECGYFVDQNWNVYGPDPTGKSAWITIPNEGKDPAYPMWNWDHARPGPATFPEPGVPRDYFRDSDGSIYATLKYADGLDQDMAPINWPNNFDTANRLLKWDSKGNLLFADGSHTTRKDGPAGGFADLRAIVGQVRGNLVVRDACSPATVWTSDGLYAGKLSTYPIGDPFNYLHPWVVNDPSLGPWSDDSWGGQVLQTPMGSVLWIANDSQESMVLRIGGWDGWERQKGVLTLAASTLSAMRQGDGLTGQYFSSDDLSGSPVLQRVDKAIWFGPMWGGWAQFHSVNPWVRKDDPTPIDPGTCSVRWTGYIEAPVSEDFKFTIFTYGIPRNDVKVGSKVRLWIDGKLAIDSWDGFESKTVAQNRTRFASSDPVPLVAGRRVPIKIEYAAAGGADAHLHLFWQSRSCDVRHVPAQAFYTQAAPGTN